MLPPDLFDAYRGCKRDTDYFLQWFGATAEQCGFGREQIDQYSGTQDASSQDLTGKARRQENKRAREQAKKQARKLAATQRREKLLSKFSRCLLRPLKAVQSAVILPLKDLVPMAECIVEVKASQEGMPLSVFNSARRAIETRTRIGRGFQKKTDKDDEATQSDETHTHFVDHLARVFAILQPCYPPDIPGLLGQASLISSTSKKAISTLENPYSVLEYEEIAWDAPNCMPSQHQKTAASTKSRKPTIPKKYELEDTSDDDALLALHYYTEDCNHLRQHINELWSKYKARGIDLLTASLLTHAALDNASSTEKRILEEFPKFKDYEYFKNKALEPLIQLRAKAISSTNVPSHLRPQNSCTVEPYPASPSAETSNEAPPKNERPITELSEKAVLEAREWAFDSVFQSLSSFIQKGTKDLNLWKNDLDALKSIMSSTTPRQEMRPSERSDEDVKLLENMLVDFFIASKPLPELHPLATYDTHFNMLANDPIVNMLSKAVETGEIIICLAFAFQVNLDILYELRPNLAHGWEAFKIMAHRVSDLSEECLGLQKVLKHEFNQLYVEKVMLYQFIFLEFAQTDFIAQYRKKNCSTAENGVKYAPFTFLSHNPLLCGRVIGHSLFRVLHQMTVVVYNLFPNVTMVAHIYNAAKQQGFITDSWEDMETIMKTYNEDFLFVGDVPKDPETCFKRYMLFTGVSLASFAISNGRKKERMERIEPEMSKEKSRASSLSFSDVLYSFCPNLSLSFSLSDKNYIEPCLRNLPSTASETATIVNQWKKTGELTVPQLLWVMEAAVAPCVPVLLFDSFTMLSRCAEDLRLELWTVISETLQKTHLASNGGSLAVAHAFHYPDGMTMSNTVALILGVSQPEEKHMISLWGEESRKLHQSLKKQSILRKAAEKIKAIIDKSGGVENKKAAALMQCLMYRIREDLDCEKESEAARELKAAKDLKAAKELKAQNESMAQNDTDAAKDLRALNERRAALVRLLFSKVQIHNPSSDQLIDLIGGDNQMDQNFIDPATSESTKPSCPESIKPVKPRIEAMTQVEDKPEDEAKVQNRPKAKIRKPIAGSKGDTAKEEGDFGFAKGFLKGQMF